MTITQTFDVSFDGVDYGAWTGRTAALALLRCLRETDPRQGQWEVELVRRKDAAGCWIVTNGRTATLFVAREEAQAA